MKKIDRETVQRILDAADIVEVVSDFVSLKKRGANYIGLCPFHNERTPSFSVSKAKGICKCFSCGKGGSPVGFVMEHEQMSYNEALRYLAKKYNIEIREREVTDAERQEITERESMLAVNDFALKHFEYNMAETADGRDIGLAYFRERGINDLMIKRFSLGYALDKPDDLYKAAISKGFNEKYLIDTGLCSRSEKGGIYDRFRGRVIYPIFSVSGRVLGFGGRTLRSDKNVAKYVNSPESAIYHKSSELYGLYQAKSAIMKRDKCILVEGYMDVISMHQAGVENVVASSGTSLTDGQVRLIHRFTKNVTVIYDSDPAGIKASLRGIDMLLAEGLDIKVVLLPDGDDPDSFAQHNSSQFVEEYIATHEQDFIRFKTNILLKDAGDDPIQRARVITNIIDSIAVIPDTVTRTVYLAECSRMLGINEKTLSLQLGKSMAAIAERNEKARQLQKAADERFDDPAKNADAASSQHDASASANIPLPAANKLRKPELVLAKYIVKYGLLTLEGSGMTVVDFIANELGADEIEFSDPDCLSIFNDAMQVRNGSWSADAAAKRAALESEQHDALEKAREEIRRQARDLADIQAREQDLMQNCQDAIDDGMRQYALSYLLDAFLSSPDDGQRRIATALASDKYQLSKVHTKFMHVETEEERLPELVYRAVMELKYAILDIQIDNINSQIRNASPDQANALMQQIFELYQLKSQFAKILGERIVNPR